MATRIAIKITPANQLQCGHRRPHTVACDQHGAATPRKVRREFYRRYGHLSLMAKEAAPLLIAIRDELRG